MYTGGAGGYSFYVRKSEQIIRQRKNNSNYGESASRTYPQMLRRVMWSNLVNFYKANAFWMPKAFELRKKNQTDYNRFMQLNINENTYAFTKDEALAGACIPGVFTVSEGSLLPITYNNASATPYELRINLTNSWDQGGFLSALSQDIIDSNNGRFQNGDNLALVLIKCSYVNEIPKIEVKYQEMTLDTSATETDLADIDFFTSFEWANRKMVMPDDVYPSMYSAFVVIHTRKEGGKLLTSTQELIVPDTRYENYASPAHIEEAILSYGVDARVLLDPGAV